MRHLLRLSLLVAALALPAAACSSNPGSARPASRVEPTFVKVNNQAWLDVTVYVVQGSSRIRLGTVTSNNTTRLQLPNGIVFGPTTLSFIVDPIGSNRTASSFQIQVSPGEEVQLTVPPTVGR